MEAKEVHVEQHEEHGNEGEEAKYEGHHEATKIVPALAQRGRQ